MGGELGPVWPSPARGWLWWKGFLIHLGKAAALGALQLRKRAWAPWLHELA